MNKALRYELKLTCAAGWLSQARSWIRLHPEGFRVAHPPRTVNSLYLDTLDLDSLNANLFGVSARQKLRLRWYGETPPDSPPPVVPILELKYKKNMLGGKNRFPLPVAIDLAQPWSDTLKLLYEHVPPDWQSLLNATSRPTLLNRYRREYYVTPDNAIRATLDFDQRAYDQRLALRPNLHASLTIDDFVVIEIKAGREHEERLQELAGHFPLRRSRNSKYVNGVLAALGTSG